MKSWGDENKSQRGLVLKKERVRTMKALVWVQPSLTTKTTRGQRKGQGKFFLQRMNNIGKQIRIILKKGKRHLI